MWFGWRTLNIDKDGVPSQDKTQWQASCFILFTHVVYIGEVVESDEII